AGCAGGPEQRCENGGEGGDDGVQDADGGGKGWEGVHGWPFLVGKYGVRRGPGRGRCCEIALRGPGTSARCSRPRTAGGCGVAQREEGGAFGVLPDGGGRDPSTDGDRAGAERTKQGD